MSTSSVSSPTAATAVAANAHPRPASMKRFTHAQIAEKVAARTNVPEYHALLMSCAVSRDDEGVMFDSTMPGWRELVRKCQEADRRDREQQSSPSQSSPPPQPQSQSSSSPTPNVGAVASSFLSKMTKMMATPKISPSSSSPEPVLLVTRDIPTEGQQAADDWVSVDRKKAVAMDVRKKSGASDSAATPATAHPVSASQRPRRQARPADINDSEQPSATAAVTAAQLPPSQPVSGADSPSMSDAVSPQRRLQLMKSVDRTSVNRLKRAATRELKDASFVQADLAFEQRLWREMSADDATLIEEWKQRRSREIERENHTKVLEEKEAKLTGRKRRKLQLPPGDPVYDGNSKVIDELNYMEVLLKELSHDDDSAVDWNRVRALARLTGIPAKHRWRAWHALLDLPCSYKPDYTPAPSTATTAAKSTEVSESKGDEVKAADWDNADSSTTAHALEAVDDEPGNPHSLLPSPSPSITVDSSVPSLNYSSESPRLDLNNQRVIRVDLDRTLPHLVTMQNPAIRHSMEIILTEQCKHRQWRYKQGMNYLLAPLFFLAPVTNMTAADAQYRQSVQSLFNGIIDRFLPNTFSDDEFGSLQCLFLWFRHCLFYHDPQLANHLLTNDMGPELYASSWFLTLHVNRCKLEIIFFLWDLFIIEYSRNRIFHYFVDLSLLIAHRSLVLKESISNLPELLSKLTLHSRKDAMILATRTKFLYHSRTPVSFVDKLTEVLGLPSVVMDGREFSWLNNIPCLTVQPDELCRSLAHADSDNDGDSDSDGDGGGVRYLVLDCRSVENYEAGHLPHSLHFDPALLDDQRRYDELNTFLFSLMSVKQRHFVVMDETFDLSENSNLISLLTFLLNRNIRYLGVVQGSYSACHSHLLAQDRHNVLVDHSPERCIECNGRLSSSKKEKKSIFTSVRKFGQASINAFIKAQTGLDASASSASSEEMEELRKNHLPQHSNFLLISSTVQLKLLFTVIRDRQSTSAAFYHSINRVLAILMGAVLEKLVRRERQVKTASGGLYTGSDIASNVYIVSVSDSDSAMARVAFQPYRSLVAQYHDIVAIIDDNNHCQLLLPGAVGDGDHNSDSAIVIFLPIIDERSQQRLALLVQHLLAQGLDNASILVVAITGGRSLLWLIDETFPNIRIIVASVDELRAVKGDSGGGGAAKSTSQLVPGINELARRWQEQYSLLAPLDLRQPQEPQRN